MILFPATPKPTEPSSLATSLSGTSAPFFTQTEKILTTILTSTTSTQTTSVPTTKLPTERPEITSVHTSEKQLATSPSVAMMRTTAVPEITTTKQKMTTGKTHTPPVRRTRPIIIIPEPTEKVKTTETVETTTSWEPTTDGVIVSQTDEVEGSGVIPDKVTTAEPFQHFNLTSSYPTTFTSEAQTIEGDIQYNFHFVYFCRFIKFR